MKFKNNFPKILKERGLTLAEFSRMCDLISVNTLERLNNNPSYNATIQTIVLIADALECSINELIEDELWKVVHDEEISKIDEAGSHFNKENIALLEKLLVSIGVIPNIEPYSRFKSVTIRSLFDYSPIDIDLNLRLHTGPNQYLTGEQNKIEVNNIEGLTLEVVDYYIAVNREIFNEKSVNNLILEAIEIYARKNNIEYILLNISEKESQNFTYNDEDNVVSFNKHSHYHVIKEVFQERGYFVEVKPDCRFLYSDRWIKRIK